VQQAAEVYAEKEKSLYIQTVKGRRFYMAQPSFDIEEIAHATSMQCRFTGHTRHFYSVAQHSVLVSYLVELLPECGAGPATPYEGLMHDAHEAYVSDVASPWKVLIPDYRVMEATLEARMREHFNLPAKHSVGVKLADWFALFIEARDFFPPGISDDWVTPSDDFRAKLAPVLEQFRVESMLPAVAAHVFLERFHKLNSRR
jgi:uncharacterized protein